MYIPVTRFDQLDATTWHGLCPTLPKLLILEREIIMIIETTSYNTPQFMLPLTAISSLYSSLLSTKFHHKNDTTLYTGS